MYVCSLISHSLSVSMYRMVLQGLNEEESYADIKKSIEEKFAWYDVISTENIVGHANVTSDWDRDESFLQSVMWA